MEVDFSKTNVDNSGLEHLKELTGLERLWLNYTQVTDAGVEKLQQTLPKCNIQHNAKE